MKKSIKVILLISLICLQSIFSSLTAFAAEESTKALSYEESVKLMLEKNLELSSLNSQLDLQKEIVKETKQEAERLQSTIGDTEDEANEKAVKVYVNPVKEENTLASATRQLENRKFELKQELKKLYIEYASKTDMVAILKEKIKIAASEYEQGKSRLKLGMIKNADLIPYETAVKELEKSLIKTENEWDLKLVEFNYLVSGKTDIVYTPQISNINSILIDSGLDISKINTEKLYADYVAHDDTYLNYKGQLKEYEQQLHVERTFQSTAAAYKNFKKKIENTNFKIENQYKQLKYQVLENYDNLFIKQLDVITAKNDLKSAEVSNTELQAKLKLNMITKLEMQKSEIKLMEAKHAMMEALGAFDTAYNNLHKYNTTK